MRKILIFLSVLFIIIPVFSFNTIAATTNPLTINKTATAPKIDGELDDSYSLIADTKTNKDLFTIISTGTVKTDIEFYACWDNDYLYIYVKAPCAEPHVAYMDNAAEHYIFNAHYMMTALCPDDSTQSKYTGTADDQGGWEWGPLNDAKFLYEWTTIEDSKTKENVIADHFLTMSTTAGFEYDVKSGGGFDCYEQKIPLKKLVTSVVTNGFSPEVGKVFGLGFGIGLTDRGTGYVDGTDVVNFSTYFEGKKNINGLTLFKLASNLPDTSNESSEVSSQAESSQAASSTVSEPVSEVSKTDSSVAGKTSSVGNTSKVSTVSETSGDKFDDWWIVFAGAAVIVVAVAAFLIIRKKK